MFSTITDETELNAAFPAKSTMRVTRLFAELPLGSLATDLDLQASMGPVLPRSRQAPTGINYRCTEFVEVDCPGISPDCNNPSSPGSDAGIFANGDDPGVSSSGGGSFGCASASSPATMTWALGTIAGLALFGAIRRRNAEKK